MSNILKKWLSDKPAPTFEQLSYFESSSGHVEHFIHGDYLGLAERLYNRYVGNQGFCFQYFKNIVIYVVSYRLCQQYIYAQCEICVYYRDSIHKVESKINELVDTMSPPFRMFKRFVRNAYYTYIGTNYNHLNIIETLTSLIYINNYVEWGADMFEQYDEAIGKAFSEAPSYVPTDYDFYDVYLTRRQIAKRTRRSDFRTISSIPYPQPPHPKWLRKHVDFEPTMKEEQLELLYQYLHDGTETNAIIFVNWDSTDKEADISVGLKKDKAKVIRMDALKHLFKQVAYMFEPRGR